MFQTIIIQLRTLLFRFIPRNPQSFIHYNIWPIWFYIILFLIGFYVIILISCIIVGFKYNFLTLLFYFSSVIEVILLFVCLTNYIGYSGLLVCIFINFISLQ